MFDEYTINRFWSKVRIKGKNECWHWLAYTNKRGYGEFRWKNKSYRSHVFAFMITNDIILSGKDIIIRHTCNNPPCCNPNHLLEGTHQDNMHDAIKAGTHCSLNINGNNRHGEKVTKEEVRKIRQLGWYFGATEISRMSEWKNKISASGIRAILTYQTWKDVK